MGAYNRINGEPSCASKTYLGNVLCGKFGFDGYITADCGAICDINNHHKVTANEAESAALAVNNGCYMNCGTAYKWLKTAVTLGLVTEETITKGVEKLFTARFRLGMFDDDCEYDNITYDVVSCEKHRKMNRKMAQESIVLLKNNGILPLKDVKTIAVIGPNADDRDVLLGNYNGMPDEYSTLLRGIQDGSNARVIYARGCHLYKIEYNEWAEQDPTQEAVIAARNADVVILCMGLNSMIEGEEGDAYNGDASGDKRDLEFPESQQKLINAILETGKPTIFVNVAGSCMNLSLENEKCDAVIQCCYPGAEGGNALADIIFGKVSPSGRLPVTFYKSVDDLPAFEDYSMKNRTYKFYEGTPLYEFGHGLTYSDISENWLDENTVEITNKGEYDTNYSVLKFEYIPHKNLCGFKKLFIKKGEKIKVKF